MRARVPIPRKAFGSGPDKFEVDAIAQVTRAEQLVPKIYRGRTPLASSQELYERSAHLFRGSAPEMLLSDVEKC